MGKIEKKHSSILILTLAGFFISTAWVLILLTSTALAQIPDSRCEEWALEIKARTENIRDDTDNFDEGRSSNRDCKNLCEGGTLRDLDIATFLRKPAGILSAATTDYPGTPGDRAFSTGLYGSIAFFCANTEGTEFTSAVVAIQHPDASACGTEYKSICDAPLSSPITITLFP